MVFIIDTFICDQVIFFFGKFICQILGEFSWKKNDKYLPKIKKNKSILIYCILNFERINFNLKEIKLIICF